MSWRDLERYRRWPGEIAHREEKEALGARVAARAESGQVIGVGSGSTAFLALLALGERAAEEGLLLTTVPTSIEVGLACAAAGLAVSDLDAVRPDWGFDGADEVEESGGVVRLIKGRGGALFREKLVMASQATTLILADRSKLVTRLGERFAVPVEVVPRALHLVEERLERLGATEVALRLAGGKDGPVVTEGGNLLLDARFDAIADALEAEIKAIPGVVESGLFIGYPVEVITP